MIVKPANRVESLSWRLCAYRLDPNVSADTFVQVLDKLIEAARDEGRKEPTGGADAPSENNG